MATARVDAASEQAVREMLFAAAQAVERDADDIAGEIADVLDARGPGDLAPTPETREDILLRGRAGLLSWARAFLRGVAPDEVESPAEAYAYARALARRGVPLDVLLRIHRLALGVLLQAWEARLDAGDSAELLLAGTRRSIEVNFQFHDALMEGLERRVPARARALGARRGGDAARDDQRDPRRDGRSTPTAPGASSATTCAATTSGSSCGRSRPPTTRRCSRASSAPPRPPPRTWRRAGR